MESSCSGNKEHFADGCHFRESKVRMTWIVINILQTNKSYFDQYVALFYE